MKLPAGEMQAMGDKVEIVEVDLGLDTGVDLDALIGAQRVLADLLPDVELHGRIAKAGPTKTFSQTRSS